MTSNLKEGRRIGVPSFAFSKGVQIADTPFPANREKYPLLPEMVIGVCAGRTYRGKDFPEGCVICVPPFAFATSCEKVCNQWI